MAQKERGDAEFQVPVLGLTGGRRLRLFLQNLGHVAQRAILRLALGQGFSNLLDRAGVAFFPFHQQRLQVNQHRLDHESSSNRIGYDLKVLVRVTQFIVNTVSRRGCVSITSLGFSASAGTYTPVHEDVMSRRNADSPPCYAMTLP